MERLSKLLAVALITLSISTPVIAQSSAWRFEFPISLRGL